MRGSSWMQASGIASHFLFRMAQSLFVITVPCVLPDRDPVFRRQIHSVAFLYIIGFHKFIELLKGEGMDLSSKYATQITTSKHFYDVTAFK